MLRPALLSIIVIVTSALSATAQDTNRLVVLTHDSFAIPEPVLEAFEAATGTTVEILRSGDAGKMVNQAILTKNNPLGDVIYGVDNTFLSRALTAEIFVPYESTLLPNVRSDLIPDVSFLVTPVNFGDVCLNYDIAWFAENELALPESLADLTRDDYAGLLVVENPATSSPGLAFLLATIAEFGDNEDYNWIDYWTDLRDNDVLVADGWTDAYYSHFTIGSRGDGSRPLVVSYASSPPAEVLYGEDPEAGAVSAAIIADNMCFRQVEYVGVLAGAENEAAAKQFVDFMLSVAFQEELPLNMFVFPVREDIQLPEVFVEYALIAEYPAQVDSEMIEENRETWIQTWAEVMLR